MTRRASLALTLTVVLLLAGGMSGIYIQEGHFTWQHNEVQP